MTFSWFSYIPANFQMPYLTWCEILNFPLNFFTLNISLCMWPLNSFMSVYLILFQALIIKVRTFWEAHKNLRNLPHALYIYLVNVQTMRKIFSNFVCFSESPNFNDTNKNFENNNNKNSNFKITELCLPRKGAGIELKTICL